MNQYIKLLTKVKDTSKNANEKIGMKFEINDYVSFFQFSFTLQLFIFIVTDISYNFTDCKK